MDFTLGKYWELLQALKDAGYLFQTFERFLLEPAQSKVVVLRHDVDKLPANSLATAKVESAMGISAVYYFRAVAGSWDEVIIKEIASLGHEVGYHYESLTTCGGDMSLAYQDFRFNLERLRELVDVKTICMHGSPRSQHDSKDIWNQYSYRDLDIIGEPYFDVDFTNIFYLTDTGRRWDGYKYSRRDKVAQQELWINEGLVFRSTDDIIDLLRKGVFPEKVMFTTHPQRWTDNKIAWLEELVLQNVKNVVKRMM